jgi:hypothetical protein
MLDYSFFSNRDNYNSSIRHFKAVKKLAADFTSGKDLAASANSMIAQDLLKAQQLPAIYKTVLTEKFKYITISQNLKSECKLSTQIESLLNDKRIYIYGLYHNNDGAIFTFSTADQQTIEKLPTFEKYQLLVLYIKPVLENISLAKEIGKNLFVYLHSGTLPQIKLPIDNIEKNTPKVPPPDSVAKLFSPKQKSKANVLPVKTVDTSLTKKITIQKITIDPEEPVKPKVNLKRSVMVPVVVTNELFHNGNVEAWKRIIASYEKKYPENTVNIYYDGEIIKELNALFEWGKVKTGTSIFYDINGVEINDLIKLKKYLYEGASHRFGKFLKGSPHQILKLF